VDSNHRILANNLPFSLNLRAAQAWAVSDIAEVLVVSMGPAAACPCGQWMAEQLRTPGVGSATPLYTVSGAGISVVTGTFTGPASTSQARSRKAAATRSTLGLDILRRATCKCNLVIS
jgi:hypothetical protein